MIDYPAILGAYKYLADRQTHDVVDLCEIHSLLGEPTDFEASLEPLWLDGRIELDRRTASICAYQVDHAFVNCIKHIPGYVRDIIPGEDTKDVNTPVA